MPLDSDIVDLQSLYGFQDVSEASTQQAKPGHVELNAQTIKVIESELQALLWKHVVTEDSDLDKVMVDVRQAGCQDPVLWAYNVPATMKMSFVGGLTALPGPPQEGKLELCTIQGMAWSVTSGGGRISFRPLVSSPPGLHQS